MSHSAFRILTNDEPIERNLVIVVNKNGQVATDTEALQNLLTSKGDADTGISILRETSPTPSITKEIDQERSERYEMRRQEYLSAHAGEEIDEEELENQIRLITGSIEDEIPHVTLNVENFYTSDQARKFANDVLHLGGIDNPASLMPIDINFRRQTIQNDHCYTPLTQSPERPEKPTPKSKNAQNKSLKSEQKPTPKSRQQFEEESSDSGEAALDDDEEYEEEQSGEEEDVSFSESDDDNDIDFSVNDRFGKKGKKKRKYRKHSKQKNMTFKDFLETGDVSQVDNEPKKKYNKSPKKAAVSRPSTSGKINTSTTSKNTQQNVIVKKIVQQPLPTVKNNTIRKESTAQFVPLNASFMRTQPMGQISVHTSQLRTLSGPITIQSQPMKSQQEFVESLVKDLETSFPENNKSLPNTIPNIMQMMETSTPVEVFDQTLDQLDAADGAVPGIEEINDVLAVLGNDAIDELLNQNDLINFDTSAPILKLTQGLLSSTMAHSHPILATSEATSSISTQMPKILNKQAPAKDQIKVVRNGRVITLPPIEAPATRGAKRRAQGDSPNTSISSPTTGKVAKTERTPSSKDPESANSSRRSSFAKSESGKSSRRQSFAQSAVAADEEMDDLESVEEGASEDDPDRLWCICRQPHNNRFMICCDKCEEWFHGKCVNVTKAMGAEFEQKKKEWRCPNCRAEGPGVAKKVDSKKKPLNQQKLTAFFAKSQKESTDEDVAKTVCVVCKEKPARDSSIYCSDECIQNHATKHLDDSSPKTPVSSKTSETGKRGNVLKDKSGNVIVYDKTTGIILPLSKSPHFTTLGQWLSRNPNFEPVKPGSAQAEQLLSRNRAQSQPQNPTSTTSPVKTIIQTATGEDLFSNPVKIHTGVTTTPVAAKKPPGQGQHSGNSVRTNVSMKNTSSLGGVKAAQKPPSVTSTSAKTLPSKPEAKRPVKSQQSEGRSLVDRERAKIRNIFKETLQTRMKDFDHPSIPKMTEEEIDSFVKETEKEMFYYFNKDIREKYKAKYRSLKFNLGDVKNKTILERVCAKKLTPKQLVELPPAALASEELAKWREDENKHQLEIITKSELDALAQTKIVVKTHKGEEIIEQKSVSTDISVPTIDDVESVIAKSVLSVDDPHGRYDLSRSISVNNSTNSPLVSPGSTSTSARKPDSRHRSRSRSKSRGRDHHHHHKSSSKHKKSERHRSRSPRYHKDGKSRERSKSKKSDDHKHYREKSKSREKDKTSGSSSRSRDQRHDKPKDMKKKEEVKPVGTLDIQPDQQDVDLVGKILDSMGVHLDKPLVPKEEKPKEEEVKAVIKEATPPVQTKKLVEIYSGKIYMAEITDFDVTASIVSGSFDDIVKVLPSQLDAVGRIEPSTVVDYLDKVKRLPGKELCILRFSPTEDSKTSYDEFFNYLHSRQRYGVIKLTSPRVKDFYLVPVKAGQPLPKVLLPISSPGFVEGEEHRPDLLVGVLLKVAPEDRTKKQSINMKKMQSKSRPLPDNKTLQSKHKSQTSKLTMGLPEFSKTGELQTSSSKKSPTDTNDDGDEPYTPFDDDELMIQSNYKPSSSSVAVSKQASDDLESQMEKINREIEQRQMEIQSLAKRKLDDIDEEQASRIFENISVPHNLSEMLSTISKNQASEMKAIEIDDNDDDDEYVPIPMTSSMDYRSSVTHPSYSAVNQQQTPIVNSMMDIDERIAMFQSPPSVAINVDDQPSRLASMTAADLMKLVPDGAFEPPSPPIISEPNQPSIPGLGNDDYEME